MSTRLVHQAFRTLGEYLHAAIPEGRPLAEDVWRKRHRGIVVLVWLHAVGIGVFAVVAGYDVRHSLLEAGVVAVAATLAGLGRGHRKLRSALACFGLMTSSALLVHLSGGYIEFHFHFFVMVGLMALYQDWATFLLAVSYVVVHHGVVGVLDPRSVYNHGAAWDHPWFWAGVHGTFILAMSIVSLFTWRLNEAALARTQLILDSTAEGIFGVDVEGRTIFVNLAATRMLGWKAAELMGRPVAALVADGFRAGPGESGEADFRGRDGHVFPVEYVSSEIRERNAVVGTVVAFKDITERRRTAEALRQAEAQFRQAQKMEAVGQLAGGIAHDFNNLLTVIIGHAQLLRRRLTHAADLNDVEMITSTSDRAAALTRRLLAFGRKQILQPRVQDLRGVVSSMLSMLKRLIGEHIELVTVADTAATWVKVDATQLEQVILNLAVNARDAMPNGGSFTIDVRNVPGPPATVLLVVKDTGCGMDAQTQAHIFEPFFSTKGPGNGTGLGLATVYGIVQQHDGTIEVETAPGAGTTFRITLPRADAPADDGAGERPRPRRLAGRETILLVEDDDGVRRLARDILKTHGYTVLAAGGPVDALSVAEEHAGPIHALVTDVIMPAMSGRELATRLVGPRPEMRAVYMSGYPGQVIASHGVLEGDTVFVQKPFTIEALTGAVREALDTEAR